MIKKIIFFKIKNHKYIQGIDLDNNSHHYMINTNYFLLCYDLDQSYSPIKTIKLSNEEKDYLRIIKTDLLLFDSNKDAISFFKRKKTLNKILNEEN